MTQFLARKEHLEAQQSQGQSITLSVKLVRKDSFALILEELNWTTILIIIATQDIFASKEQQSRMEQMESWLSNATQEAIVQKELLLKRFAQQELITQ